VADKLDLKFLYNLLSREIENDSLQYIQSTTYRDIADILGNLKGQSYDGIEGKVMNALMRLVEEIARLLLCVRLEKIRNSKIDYSNLTEEEQYIAVSEKKLRIHFEQVLSATLEGRVKALEGIALKSKMVRILLRFISPAEVISGKDNSRYGPFEEEDIAVLPFENAKQLIEQGVAVELPLLDQ